jgi:hypothetical protein
LKIKERIAGTEVGRDPSVPLLKLLDVLPEAVAVAVEEAVGLSLEVSL